MTLPQKVMHWLRHLVAKLKKKRVKVSKVHRKFTLDNIGIISLEGFPNAVAFDTGTKRLERILPIKISQQLHETPLKWNVLLACLCKNDQEYYFYQAHVRVVEPIDFYGMRDVVSHHMAELRLDIENQDEFIRAGWIAVPKDIEFNDDESYELFRRLRGFKDSLWNS